MWLKDRGISLVYLCFIALGVFDTLVGALEVPVFDFNGGMSFIEVPEDTPVGSIIGTLKLSNGNNLRIKSRTDYVNVTADVTGYGSIDVDIILNTILDHDYGPSMIQLTFEGENDEVQNVNFQLLLIVNDINDESPLLVNQPYSVTVKENATMNTVVSDVITADDPDEGDKLTYRLLDVNAEFGDMFSINHTTGQLILQGQLDFETTNFYHYTVVVEDLVGHNATTIVTIAVEDVPETLEDRSNGTADQNGTFPGGDNGNPYSALQNITSESVTSDENGPEVRLQHRQSASPESHNLTSREQDMMINKKYA